MTAALTSTPTALPTAAASPFAGLFTRVKRIDPQELFAVAAAIVEQQNAAAGAATGTAGATGAAAATRTQPQAAEAQQTLAAQQAAATKAQASEAERVQAAQAQADAVAKQEAQAATARAQTQTATTASAAPATSTSTGAANASGAVKIPSSTTAPRTTFDYWTKHMAQFAGKYLPDGPTMRPNCGPASTTMALRMIGLDIPGFNGQNSEAVLDKARVLATGKNDTSVGTTDSELETLITKSGGQWSESTNFGEIKGWVKQGIPVVLSGNPAYGWNSRYSSDQVYPFNGGHWVTVSGFDEASGNFIVNDPLSQIGPIYVSETELKSYNNAHGKLGIAVFK